MVERIRTLLESRQLTPTQFADLIGVARPIVSHILSGRNKPSLEVVQRILAAMPELAMPWLLNGNGPMLAVADASPAESRPAEAAPAAAIPVQPAPTPTEPVVSSLPAVSVRASAFKPEPTEAPQFAHRELDAITSRSVSARVASVEPPVAKRPLVTTEPAASRPAPFKPAPARPVARPKRFVAVAASASKAGGPPAPEAIPEPLEPPAASASAPNGASAEPVMAPMAEPSAISDSILAASVPSPENTMAQALLAGGTKPIRRIVIFYHDGSFADYQPE